MAEPSILTASFSRQSPTIPARLHKNWMCDDRHANAQALFALWAETPTAWAGIEFSGE
jgi:hypothetical protein